MAGLAGTFKMRTRKTGGFPHEQVWRLQTGRTPPPPPPPDGGEGMEAVPARGSPVSCRNPSRLTVY